MNDQYKAIDDVTIAKFLAGEATPEEAMQVVDWVDQSADNKLLFEQLQKIGEGERYFRLTPEEKSRALKLILAKKTGLKKSHKFVWTPLRIAASLLMAAVIGVTIYFLRTTVPTDEEWITKQSQDEITKLPLPEGTSVVLNKNSVLAYPKEFTGGTRTVRLSGEAFFDVVHQPEHPFVVDCDEVSIQVLGTAFDINRTKNDSTIETQVVRGKVKMYTPNSSIDIDAGWIGWYDRRSKKLALRKAKSENHVGYATHTFTFEDSSLKQVTENLSNSFGVAFVFENEKIKDCRLTSAYHDKPLKFILDVIAESLNLTYVVRKNTVYFSGNGCL
jgi:ferric-dicitrate binding protein FerR (iron transport regulator)